MASYVLAPGAQADLRDIARYTRRQWGKPQALKYRDRLEKCAETIALGEGRSKDLSDIHPGLRMVRCEHHFIFCLPRGEAPALIVAILHERLDLMRRLATRLG